MKKLIFGETDYTKFKTIDGNRAVRDGRVAKIINSIKARGFIGAIVVNEKMEVIDGQGRLAACKALGVPIDYIVEEGLSIDDCISMNISGSPWGLRDFIDSYADRGFTDYVILRRFLEKSKYSFEVSCYAILGTKATNLSQIKTGGLTISQEQLVFGNEILDFWSHFDGIITNRKNDLYVALMYCYKMHEVDNARLIHKVNTMPKKFEYIANVTEAIDAIEDCYNDRRRGAHVYIETEYFKMLEEKSTLAAANAMTNKLRRRP